MQWIVNLIARAAYWLASRIMIATGISASAALAVSFVIVGTTALMAGRSVLGRLMKIPDITLGQQGMAILGNAPSNSAPIPVIYGTRRIGGTRIFVGTSDSWDEESQSTNKDNAYLNMIFILGEGPITEISKVYANDKEIWPIRDSRFFNWPDYMVTVETHLGEENQKASTEMKRIAYWEEDWSWGDNHTLSGLAYVYVRLAYHPKVWAAGVPVITCDVKGKKVWDWRPSVTGGAAAIERFSDNPALCIRDYLTNTTYGKGISESLISNSSFNAAADYCDEQITLTKQISGVETTVTQKRYTCNGVVNTSESNMNTLKKLLTSCRGSLIFSGGFYKLVLDKAETASLTFDESNVLGDYEIFRGGKDMVANQVAANFFNPDREWQGDFAYEKSDTYKAEDNDLLLETKIELPFTADMLMAKYIALQNLKASRQNIFINFKTTQEGLLTEVGDIIYVKLENPGWDTLNSNQGKMFRVLQIGIEANDEVSISAIEYDATTYTTDTLSWDDSPNTSLPSMDSVKAPTALTLSETLFFNEPTVTNRVAFTWTSSTSSFVSSYDVAYKKNNDVEWIKVGNVTGSQFNIDNLEPGVYTFNVASTNNAGYTSDYATKNFRVKGTSVLPAVNPPGITGVTESLISTTLGSGIKAKATLSWVAVSNSQWEGIGVNVERYEVEYKLTSESTNWEQLGSSTGTYFDFFDIKPDNYNFRVRAVNDAGVKSAFAETTAEITGLSAKPDNVSSFYMRTDGVEAHLSWKPTTDLDVKVGGTFEIRHSVLTSGATWQQSIQIGDSISGSSNSATMPLLTGTYFIKAVDSTDNKSDSATSIINTVSPSVLQKRTQATVTDTAFAGTKVNMEIDSTSGYLKLEADTLWDSMTTMMDTWRYIDSIGGVDLSGSYEFSDKIDITLAGGATLSGGVKFTTLDVGDAWDLRTGNIDTWASIDLGSDFDDVLAGLLVSTTNDDPADSGATWSDYQEFTIGNYYGRGFKFKLEVTTGDNSHQINVSELTAKAEVYYKNQSDTVTTSASGSALTYSEAFRVSPQILITAQDLQTGDYYTITSTSSTGFTLQFFNSSGTGVARSAYYLARGY